MEIKSYKVKNITINMRKLSIYCFKNLIAISICMVFFSCDEETIEIPFFSFAKVTKCERDSISMVMAYNNDGLSEYNLYENDTFVGRSFVRYTPSYIQCSIKGIDYKIQLSNTKGVYRIESLEARVGQVLWYYVQYWFDADNRLIIARVDGSDLADKNRLSSVFISYKYVGNTIEISDGGFIELSTEDNLGYVCNVLDFAGSPHTSKYVINPDLYFLNIYGSPILKLPKDQEIRYTNDNQRLLSVGKYQYDY